MALNNEERKIKKSGEKKTPMKDKPDEKLLYLVRTLSRTKRKDYENYVVNTIWNRLDNDTLEIVTQQYIHNPTNPKKDQYGKKRKHYFIDLYFPSLNIGIECDEAPHFYEENKKLDKEREVSIYDALHEIGDKGYRLRRINVTQTYDKVQDDINKAVSFIKQEIKRLDPKKWKIQTAEEYYKEKDEIRTDDKVSFKTITEACNILFSTEYEGQQHAFFYPKINGEYIFDNSIYKDHRLWFPKLAIPDPNNPNDVKKMISPTGK